MLLLAAITAIIIGVAGFLVWRNSHSTTTRETVATTDPAPIDTTPGDPLYSGKAIMCAITAVNADALLTGTAYTDGHGKAYQDYVLDKMTFGTLINPTSTYVWGKMQGVKDSNKGTIMPTKPEYAQNMQFTSGEYTLGGTLARYDCHEWQVDPSVFQPPSDITFITKT